MYLLYSGLLKLMSSTHFSWIMKSTFQEMIRRDWNFCPPKALDRGTASRAGRTRHHKTWSTPRPEAMPAERFSKTEQNSRTSVAEMSFKKTHSLLSWRKASKVSCPATSSTFALLSHRCPTSTFGGGLIAVAEVTVTRSAGSCCFNELPLIAAPRFQRVHMAQRVSVSCH